MKRICIYAKDVQRITGKSPSHGRAVLRKIRRLKNKDKSQPVTIFEYSEYSGIDIDQVKQFLI